MDFVLLSPLKRKAEKQLAVGCAPMKMNFLEVYRPLPIVFRLQTYQTNQTQNFKK
jgi:hypothetical protein